MKANLGATVLLLIGTASHAQVPSSTPAASVELSYYDNWPGVWHRIDGDRIDSLPTFIVRRGPGTSFLENWYQVIDGKREPSFALRSWDPATGSWRLIWVSDPDYFQIWDGIRLPDGWYIIRRFGEGADSFLSRQAWIPEGADRLYRTIERSTDGGKTWTFRYREFYQRVPESPAPRQDSP
jgi:hypothetical protein